MPHLEKLGFEDGPSFFCFRNVWFQLQLQIEILSLTNQLSWIGVAKWMILANNRRANLETNLPRVRHMSRSKFFYLGLPNPVLKSTFLNVCGLHMRAMFESCPYHNLLEQSVFPTYLLRVSFHVGRPPIIF